jgi:hypothetical protein
MALAREDSNKEKTSVVSGFLCAQGGPLAFLGFLVARRCPPLAVHSVEHQSTLATILAQRYVNGTHSVLGAFSGAIWQLGTIWALGHLGRVPSRHIGPVGLLNASRFRSPRSLCLRLHVCVLAVLLLRIRTCMSYVQGESGGHERKRACEQGNKPRAGSALHPTAPKSLNNKVQPRTPPIQCHPGHPPNPGRQRVSWIFGQ